MTHRLLSTKKLKPSLIEKAKNDGVEIIEQDFISIQHIETPEKTREVTDWFNIGIECAIFTSSNAVIPFRTYLQAASRKPEWKIFSLSGQTMKELQQEYANGMGIIMDTANDGSSLSKKITSYGIKEALYFCGNLRRDELPRELKKAGVQLHEVVVYETTASPSRITAAIDGVMFFSPSAAEAFFEKNQLEKEMVCFAIGPTTAERVGQLTSARVIQSNNPDQEAMLDLVTNYFKKKNETGGPALRNKNE
jgi:uroporphyrinogen-III synthase